MGDNVSKIDTAAVGEHDLLRHCQADSRPLGLGGFEETKDVDVGRYAGTVVGDADRPARLRPVIAARTTRSSLIVSIAFF
jgi:hypothetical protein